MKKLILSILTLAILITLNYFASNIFQVSFIELSFPIGLSCTFILGFMSTEGDFTSRFADWKVGYCLDKSVRNHYFTKVHLSIPLLKGILYTIVSAILNLVMFWEYF